MRIMIRKSTSAHVRVVGIVGAGQLARLMCEAAPRLGLSTRVLAAHPEDCAVGVADDAVIGSWADPVVLGRFGSACDVVTFDHELVPLDVLAAVAHQGLWRPSTHALAAASDKRQQRFLARSVGLGVVEHQVVYDGPQLVAAVGALGLPVVAKAATGGYDGNGVRWLRTCQDVADLADLADRADLVDRADQGPMPSRPYLLEPELEITTELAVTVVRSASGDTASYPVVRTEQVDGVCWRVTAPADTSAGVAAQLREAALAIAGEIDHVGVLTVEAFVVDGELFLNELAPRPHNSAHYTLDGCATSQFENHLRAVADLPLGPTTMTAPAAVMVNLFDATPSAVAIDALTSDPLVHLHLYGKAPRPGRKVGHLTLCGTDPNALGERAAAMARDLRPWASGPISPAVAAPRAVAS